MSDGWDRSTVDLPGGVSLPVERKPAPDRLGRYMITDPIAAGGMGFVYAAYDPELDRKVALKVVHPRRSHNPGSHSRLVKEARALARLDHPNVVKVHDVFSHEDQIVVVMELVAGDTLSDWEAAKPRTWREIVEVYAQAGDGLAAAHALDIVHRDFKPHNAIIGADGRVRVLDFGLARMTTDDVAESEDPAASGAITQTVPGAVMGTPAYASPEQLEGGASTPASDQFSFCVALHRALEGKPPFTGETINALVLAIRNEAPAKGDREVPVWLRSLVARGLEPSPERRHPSMQALLVDLKKPRGWKRWRWPAIVTALVATAGVTSFSIRGDASSVMPCDGGEVATIWDPASRMAVGVAIEKIGTPYAHEVADKVLGGMDSHAGAWREAHRGACMAHRGGASSDLMFDRETSCLAQRLGEIKSAANVLRETTKTTLSGAADVAAGVHDPNACTDLARLLDDSVPPQQIRAQVSAVREHIDKAAALRRAGRVEQAERDIALASTEAAAVDYPPVVAEAQLEFGRILLSEEAYERAALKLQSSVQTALANNLPSLAVEAAARRIFAEGQITVDVARMIRDLDFAEALSRSLVGDQFARALLLNNAGTVYGMARHSKEALDYYNRARQVVVVAHLTDVELSSIDLNLGMLSPDHGAGVRLLANVVARRSAALGYHHPSTLKARFALASYDDDPRRALTVMKSVCDDFEKYHPSMSTSYLMCLHDVALLEEHLGDEMSRRAALTRLVKYLDDNPSADISVWRRLSEGQLAMMSGDRLGARTQLSLVAHLANDPTWQQLAWEAELFLSQLDAMDGDKASSRKHAVTASSGFESIRQWNTALKFQLRAEEAKTALRH